MAHIFFIDPIEKLNIKKDSTLMLALSFIKKGHEAYLMFEKDFYITNNERQTVKLYSFTGEFAEDGFYLNRILLQDGHEYELSSKDTIHMRIDPPYDTRYQRYLWMLDFLEEKSGCCVMNSPLKIMKYNEKLVAYKNKDWSVLSFVGSSLDGFKGFLEEVKALDYQDVILKPLDLYSGIGVQKVSLTHPNLEDIFVEKVKEFSGAIVCQPFLDDVYSGEYRSIYFDGVEIGTIIKRPKEGEYLANIAQGGSFEAIKLPGELKEKCDIISKELYNDGVRLLAFDLLGGGVNEVNVTCPGLLVEVSYALNENLCNRIIDSF